MLDIPTSSSMLFAGITQDEAKLMLPCLGATRRVFSREERIMRAGQPTEYLGVVLSGRVRIEVSDAWGETTILEMLDLARFSRTATPAAWSPSTSTCWRIRPAR